MEAWPDIAASGSKHHLAALGFDHQGFGFTFMIDDNLRIKRDPVLLIGSQPNEDHHKLAAEDSRPYLQ